jgi:hypothetical protein
MYIAFFVIHKDFSLLKTKYVQNLKVVIENCVNDNNFVHIFFSSPKHTNMFDKLFTQTRVEMFHDKSKQTDEIQSASNLYFNYLSKTGYDYDWIIKIRPDMLFFDKNIFHGIRTKFKTNMIHARARYYVGKKSLSKHQRSNWGNSYKQYELDRLLIMDDQVYLIPFRYFPYVFSKQAISTQFKDLQKGEITDFTKVESFYDMDISKIADCPEKRQTLIWNDAKIPLNIVELYCIKLSDLNLYNLYI